jgi:hypothetical protein
MMTLDDYKAEATAVSALVVAGDTINAAVRLLSSPNPVVLTMLIATMPDTGLAVVTRLLSVMTA